MRLRTLSFAAAGLLGLVVALSGPATARDRYGEPPPVSLDPNLAAEWIIQLSPGSGVVPGYTRPRFDRPAPPVVRGRAPGPSHVDRVVTGTIRDAMAHARRTEARAGVRLTHGEGRARIAGQPRDVAPRPAFDPRFLPQTVAYEGREAPGTIVVDARNKFLYLVEPGGTARRYGVGVGKEGFGWKGTQRVSRKAEWPGWTPPSAMRARERAKGRILPAHMPGGPDNPLGARALYLGSTLYRIHGTNQPWTIGQNMSSGCIRMRNEDVIDLYERVRVGARVVVS